MNETPICEKCSGPLDWRGRCVTCSQLERLREKVASTVGFREKRRPRTMPQARPREWSKPSGVESSLPTGDRE